MLALALLLLPAAQPPRTAPPLASLEREWLALRTLHDQLRLTRNLGAAVSPRGVPVDSLVLLIDSKSKRVHGLVSRVQVRSLSRADRDALNQLEHDLSELDAEARRPAENESAPPDCRVLPPDRLSALGLDSLTRRTFACYGAAARRIVVDGDTLDRLSILGLLGRTEDPDQRRRLFLALEPVWRSVNGDDGENSPYRAMIPLRNAAWAGVAPAAARARALGISPDSLEGWLVAVLEAWRSIGPDSLIEPWDFYYLNGAASRTLSPRIPLDSLRPLTSRYYRALGADPDSLRVHYDLTPRPGKYPVSFTDFGARDPVEPWIFTSYRIGGLDNLAELLHEVGHAVHIAGIRTRGAYTDWPDSDTFTEAIADLAALEVYEPAWQRRFLRTAVSAESSLRAKYSGIVLDVAWALFEIRIHRAREQSPNALWTSLTRDYLHIRPHPEWSWWAMRGQLVNHPGYMLNYAFGAVLIADVRSRVKTLRGAFGEGDPGWYAWIAPRLYRFGRARPARQVVEQLLGRPISIQAILADLTRANQDR